MQCAMPSKIREMTRIFEIIDFVIDLRVCWGQGCRGQTVVGAKVRNFTKYKSKNKKTETITLNITPIRDLWKITDWVQIGVKSK